MVDNNKNDGAPDDFDEDFDVEDFSATDFEDEVAFEESDVADLPEGEFSDEDFADEDWQDEEGSGVDESLITSGAKKKGLGFNTIAIIFALVAGGGMMAYTITNSAAKQKATDLFQSVLDISGVMDGDFFGEKKAGETPEEIASQELQTQNEGFLNNPAAVIPPADQAQNPPQPMPITAPEEGPMDNQPLLPMPDSNASPVADPLDFAPRSPEDVPPENNVAIAEMPIDQPAPAPVASAEDILKTAMENREKKIQGQETPVAPPEPVPAFEPPVAPPSPVPSSEPAVSPEMLEQNAKALERLDSRFETLMQRIDTMETELADVKNSKQQSDTQELEQMVQSLKAEIADVKNRPAAPAPSKKIVKEAEDIPVVAEKAKPQPVPKKTAPPKPKVQAQTTAAAPSRWELRAAQPGRAWVSKPGERDMQSVEVGQSLPGLGQVTSIQYQNGRWAVIGTQGQIRQ